MSPVFAFLQSPLTVMGKGVRAISDVNLFTRHSGPFQNLPGTHTNSVEDGAGLASKAVHELILKLSSPWGAEAEQRAGLEASFGNDKTHLAIN